MKILQLYFGYFEYILQSMFKWKTAVNWSLTSISTCGDNCDNCLSHPLIFKEFINLLLSIKRKLVYLTSSLSWGLPYIALTYVSFRLLYASRFPCSFLSWISWCGKTVSILTVRFIQASVRRGLELLIATCNFLKRKSKYDKERIKFF